MHRKTELFYNWVARSNRVVAIQRPLAEQISGRSYAIDNLRPVDNCLRPLVDKLLQAGGLEIIDTRLEPSVWFVF